MATYDMTFIIATQNGNKSSEKKDTDQECPDSLLLEYEFIPNTSKHNIEIAFLNQTAQIKGFDTNFTSEMFEHGGLDWTVFSLRNNVKLDKKDITYIISNDMEMNMWTQKGKAKMGKKATIQKEKEKNDSDKQENAWSSWIKKALSQELIPPATKEEKITEDKMPKNTFVDNPPADHWLTILKDIKEVREKFQEEVREKLQEEVRGKLQEDLKNKENEIKNINEKQKRKGKIEKEPSKELKNTSKTKKTEKTIIKINLASLFAGKHTVKNQIMLKEGGIKHVTVILSGKNLMEENIAEELNPLIIKINQVQGIPFKFLNNIGIKTIVIQYEIFDEMFETEKRQLSESDVLINHAKVLLTDKISNTKLLEYLQTSRLLLTVVGIKMEICQINKDLEATATGKIGKEQLIVKDDQPQTFSEIEKRMEIAVTYCNLTNLLNGHFLLEDDLPLYIAPLSKENPLHYENSSQITEINQELFLHFSSIEIFISFTFPLTLQSVRLDPTGQAYYNRMLLFIKDDEVAKSIQEDIVSFNTKIISQTDSAEAKGEENSISTEINKLKENILTGFVINSPQYSLIFIEGMSDGYILKVYNTMRNLPSIACKVLYDSKLVFASRLYDSLFPNPGIYIIILKNVFGKRLLKPSCYVKEKSKPHCQAIKLLDALIKSNSIQAAIQEKLFPSTDQLTSLDLTFGTPKIKQNND